MFDPQDVKNNKVLAAVGYFGILCFLPLLLAKDSAYAKHHGKQGLVLFIAEAIVFFVNIIPILGQIIFTLAMIFFFIMSIMGLLKALNGEKWEVPILGKYANKIEI